MLFRAICHAPNVDDHHVFIEARSREAARVLIPHVLSLLWSTPADEIVMWALDDEERLQAMAVGPTDNRPLRLFEAGAWLGPFYADPDRTLLLVGPSRLPQLRTAQAEAAALRDKYMAASDTSQAPLPGFARFAGAAA